ncbi:MAG: hypothetical protein JST06_01250 [Bacteroidetes bacterium]|nr:hypothetical protein [Bacteroidota bacterium]MBS1629180.1 hypothetical protein [Bacteroidota bacterium]
MAKKSLLLMAAACSLTAAQAQTTYLQLDQETYHLLDRLETRQGFLDTNLFLADKPVARKGAVAFLESVKDVDAGDLVGNGGIGLTKIDYYNMAHAISVSGEWASNGDGAIDSKLPWFRGAFYNKQPDFLHVHTHNFFLVANPVLSGTVIAQSDARDPDKSLFSSSRGVEIRARIAHKIGIYTYLSDNQEQPPYFVRDYIERRWGPYTAVPGADYYQQPSANTYDYLAARGYLDFAVIKNVINVTAGYDKHFIGDGYRSLFLSDFAAPATFLRINTRIWRLNYQNLFMELTPQYIRGGDRDLPHKYAAMHHLSINALRWLNVGLFESVIFARSDRFDFSYMNPIIFYRSIERANGSPDNVNIGFNFKAIAAKHLQFYGQLFFDEFKSKELFSNRGWWGNKYAVQLGGKWFDAFNLPNLDLQAEVNMVRPFTYSHYDSTATYTHYNQPLAHPLGAGFEEFVGILRYQPIPKLFISLKVLAYRQGLDSNGTNYGSNPFLNYNQFTPVNNTPGEQQYGFGMTNGVETNTFSGNLNLSYELRDNLFIDLGGSYRKMSFENGLAPDQTTHYVYCGLRLNIARRDYDFY